MTTLRIHAHFDGKSFVPEESVDLPPGTPLLLAVFAPDSGDAQEMSDEEWDRFALMAFDAAAYGNDEPDYGEADLKEKFAS